MYVNSMNASEKILKDDNIGSGKNIRMMLNEDPIVALNNLFRLIGYEYLIEVDEMNINA